MVFDKIEFPFPVPFFQLFFTPDSCLDIGIQLIIYEIVNIILGRESRDQVVFMLVYTPYEIRCDSDVQSSISFTGQYVNIILLHNNLVSRFRGNDIVIFYFKYSIISLVSVGV